MAQAARLHKNPSLLLQLSLEFGSLHHQQTVSVSTLQPIQAKQLLDEKGTSQSSPSTESSSTRPFAEHHKPMDSSHLREEFSSVVANNDFM